MTQEMRSPTAAAGPVTPLTVEVKQSGAAGWPAASARLGPALRWAAGFAAAISLVSALAWPLLDPRYSYLGLDDGQSHALRLFLLDHMLRRGVLFPRWWPDLAMGYGYPLFNFYSPGVYYLGAIVHALGVPVYNTLQWAGIGSAVAGAGGAYVLGWVLFRSSLAGVLLAGTFVLSPYPFVTTLYNRGAIPEAWGLATLPWLLAFGWLAVRRTPALWALGLAAVLAAMVLLHNLTALVSAGLLLLWMAGATWDLPPGRRASGLRRGLAGIALGLALSAFFWLPALTEQRAVYTEFGHLYEHHTYDRWLFDPFRPTPNRVAGAPERYHVTPGSPVDLHWVYPHSATSVWGPPKPSLAQAVLLVASLLAGLAGWLELRGRTAAPPGAQAARRAARPVPSPEAAAGARGPVLVAALLLAALWFLNTEWSRGVWESVPLLPVIQFPWRLWGPFSLFLATVSAATFAWLARRGRQQWVLAALLLCFVAVNAVGLRPWVSQVEQAPLAPSWPERLRVLEEGGPLPALTSVGEFLPRSITFGQPLNLGHASRAAFEAPYPSGGWIAGRVWPYSGQTHVEQVWDTPAWTEAQVSVAGDRPGEVAFRTFVFPGWRAYVDGHVAPLRPAPFDPRWQIGHGFAIVAVPPGSHRVQLAFGPTLWRSLGAAISAAGLAVCLVLLCRAVPASAAPPSRPARRHGMVPLWSAGLVAALAAGLLLAGAARDLWALRRPPGRASPAAAAIAVDLTERARASRDVQIASPGGSALGGFVDVRDQAIHGHSRRWLFMHPPAEVRVQFTVPPRAVFQTGLAVDPRAWDEPEADGVRFIAELRRPSGDTRRVLDEIVWPQQRDRDRGWRFALADLGAFAGERVTLVLRTEGRDTPFFDWAGWGSPVVYVDRSARYPPPSHTSDAVPPPPGL